jgi:hypothetical protein
MLTELDKQELTYFMLNSDKFLQLAVASCKDRGISATFETGSIRARAKNYSKLIKTGDLPTKPQTSPAALLPGTGSGIVRYQKSLRTKHD